MIRLKYVGGKIGENRAQFVTLRLLTLHDAAPMVCLCNDMMVARYIAQRHTACTLGG